MEMSVQVKKRYHRSGSTLATTMAVIGLSVILAFAMTSLSITHLRQTRITKHRALAEAAADAALADAMEMLVSDPEWGLDRLAEESVELELENAKGCLSFSFDDSAKFGVPPSTSNRFGLEPIAGVDETIIPPQSVQLHAIGQSGDGEVVLQALLQVPDFPYTVASSGAVESSGALMVGATDDIDSFMAAPSKLRKTAIAANSSVTIKGKARIIGDISATAEIALDGGVDMLGEVKPNGSPVELADLDILSLRPSTSLPIPTTFSPKLDGRFHHNGPELTITGGLEFNDGVLFVNGDVVIRGGITGKGAIISTGSLTVEGSSSLLSDSQIALVSQNDLTLRGDSTDTSFFQGLVYTEGDFEAENITVVGAFVANRKKSITNPGSVTRLRNVNLVNLPAYSDFALDSVIFLVTPDGGKPGLNYSGELHIIEVDRDDLHVLEETMNEDNGSYIREEGASRGRYGVEINDNGDIVDASGHDDPDWEAIANVTRGKTVSLKDGKVVSDWHYHNRSELLSAMKRVPQRGRTLKLLENRADSDSILWQEIRSSLHIDLNEFLGKRDRIQITSWETLR